jgi:YidC/Oxa1 family membrane protein insertase
MQELQPQIQALQDKYKGDQKKLAEELTNFYRVNKINPFGSCLPLLIQLPILIILYYVFQNGLSTARFDLLYSWMPRPETVNPIFFGLNLAQPDRWFLPIIAGALQFFQSWQIVKAQPKTDAKNSQQQMAQMMSKQMMYLMPVFTVFIAGRLPAALPLYWAVTTLFSIGQQWWVYRPQGDRAKSLELRTESAKKENTIKKNGVEITVRKKGK